MSQVVLHLGKEYIEEDLEYYFSGERDKNNQVRPDQAIYSMTPFEDHIDIDLNDGKVGNFFYPLAPNLLDRIYIGISISLFANHWGASFLLELLKLVKPGGAIILPVYPEGQAAEKGFWSRSFLENVFLSRTRWRGFSNITAENDGVMSLRVGRKWPDPLPSSIEWFYRERNRLLLSKLAGNNENIDVKTHIRNTFVDLCKSNWQEYARSAVVERVIIDYLGGNTPVAVAHVGADYGLLLNDLILSQYVSVAHGVTWHVGDVDRSLMGSIGRYFAPLTDDKHSVQERANCDGLLEDSAQVLILGDMFAKIDQSAYQGLVEQAWARLPDKGVLVVYDDLSSQNKSSDALDQMLSHYGQPDYYSLIAGCQIKPDYDISQYSVAVEKNLLEEKKTKNNVVRVLQKN